MQGKSLLFKYWYGTRNKCIMDMLLCSAMSVTSWHLERMNSSWPRITWCKKRWSAEANCSVSVHMNITYAPGAVSRIGYCWWQVAMHAFLHVQLVVCCILLWSLQWSQHYRQRFFVNLHGRIPLKEMWRITFPSRDRYIFLFFFWEGRIFVTQV